MLYYNKVALEALRLDEIKDLLQDKNVGSELFKKALEIGQVNYRLQFEKYCLELAGLDTLTEILPEVNRISLHDFILNRTKLILPLRT